MTIRFARFASETCSPCSGSDGHVFRSVATDVFALCNLAGSGNVRDRLGFIEVLLAARLAKSFFLIPCKLSPSKK